MTEDELLDYVKELLRRAIASTLEIPRDDLVKSIEMQTAVNQCLTMVMAVGYNDSLEAATDDLSGMMSALGGGGSRKDMSQRVQACYNTFNAEVAGFKQMHEMNRRGMDPKDVWELLRSQVPVDPEYEDDWLKVADAWILRGEKLSLDVAGASIYFGAHLPTPDA